MTDMEKQIEIPEAEIGASGYTKLAWKIWEQTKLPMTQCETIDRIVREQGYIKKNDDTVQVVRCKDCIWRQHLEPSGGFHHNGESVVYCMLNRRPTREDGYCNAGMRG